MSNLIRFLAKKKLQGVFFAKVSMGNFKFFLSKGNTPPPPTHYPCSFVCRKRQSLRFCEELLRDLSPVRPSYQEATCRVWHQSLPGTINEADLRRRQEEEEEGQRQDRSRDQRGGGAPDATPAGPTQDADHHPEQPIHQPAVSVCIRLVIGQNVHDTFTFTFYDSKRSILLLLY